MMKYVGRTYSHFADDRAKAALNCLLDFTANPTPYQTNMKLLGVYLGEKLNLLLADKSNCLLVSTAEDADYLSSGVLEAVKSKHEARIAVFWNNHYRLPTGISVAPVVHKYMEQGFEKANALIIVKSVISGSCVVRTNILALIDEARVDTIYIVSPVMHEDSELKLCSEFPEAISKKFVFVYFAKDKERDETSGEIKPGIGGQIYQLLGLSGQPAKIGYIPQLVKSLALT